MNQHFPVPVEDAEGEEQAELYELGFSNMNLRLDKEARPNFRPYGATAKVYPVPMRYRFALTELREVLDERPESKGSVIFQNVQMRFQKSDAQQDQRWVSLRRMADKDATIHQLRMNPKAVEVMRSWAFPQSGLILITGAMSSGKTTTGIHLQKAFMEDQGCACISIEDPIEYPRMQGNYRDVHGNVHGEWLQWQVEADAEWEGRLVDVLRCAPRWLYLGELRNATSAWMALQLANTGHTVMTTMHAGDVGQAISRFCSMVAGHGEAGGDENVRIMLGQALVGVVNQTMSPSGPDMSVLSCTTAAERATIADLIRKNMEGAINANWAKTYMAARGSRTNITRT